MYATNNTRVVCGQGNNKVRFCIKYNSLMSCRGCWELDILEACVVIFFRWPTADVTAASSLADHTLLLFVADSY